MTYGQIKDIPPLIFWLKKKILNTEIMDEPSAEFVRSKVYIQRH